MSSLMINLQTVLFLCYITNLILSLLLAFSGRSFPGAWLWVLGQGLLAAGTICDALPPGVPGWVPLVLGNGAYVAACLAYSHSVWKFRFRPRFPRSLYIFVPLELLSFVWASGQPYLVRALVFSSWMTLGSLFTAGLLLWRVNRHYRLSNCLTAFPFLALGMASLVRVMLLSLFIHEQGAGPVGESNVWFVTGAILLSTITLFGYVMMSVIHSEQVLEQKDEKIEAQNCKLTEAARAKDLFFAIIAHDLRGPIGGAARYVRKHLVGKMSEHEPRYAEVKILASSLEKTNEFLEKLLLWSRSQLQDWVPHQVPLPLEEIFEQSISLIRSHADFKEISILVSPPPYPAALGDRESVRLILGNLLSNAVKFSHKSGAVRVQVREESSQCRITVEDQGVGIDQATLGRLFRIEDKLTTLGTLEEQGNGLGLILVRSLAERNGGRITIESERGTGTRVHLWLPSVALSRQSHPTG